MASALPSKASDVAPAERSPVKRTFRCSGTAAMAAENELAREALSIKSDVRTKADVAKIFDMVKELTFFKKLNRDTVQRLSAVMTVARHKKAETGQLTPSKDVRFPPHVIWTSRPPVSPNPSRISLCPTVFEQGDIANTFYIVLSGCCSIQVSEDPISATPTSGAPSSPPLFEKGHSIHSSSPLQTVAEGTMSQPTRKLFPRPQTTSVRTGALLLKFKATGFVAGKFGVAMRVRTMPGSEPRPGAELKTLPSFVLGPKRGLFQTAGSFRKVPSFSKKSGSATRGNGGGEDEPAKKEVFEGVLLADEAKRVRKRVATVMKMSVSHPKEKSGKKPVAQGGSVAYEMIKKQRAGKSELLKVASNQQGSMQGTYGKYGRIVRYARAGDSFGEAGLAGLDRNCRNATVVAEEATELLFITREDYVKIIHDAQAKEVELLLKYLSTLAIFKDSTVADLKSLLYYFHSKEVPRNTVIQKQGDKSDSLYLIRSGEVRLIRRTAIPTRNPPGPMEAIGHPSASGTRHVDVAILGPQQHFGEGCLTGCSNDYDIVANSSSVHLFALSKNDFAYLSSASQEALLAALEMRGRWRKEREGKTRDLIRIPAESGSAPWTVWLNGIPKDILPYVPKTCEVNKEQLGGGQASCSRADNGKGGAEGENDSVQPKYSKQRGKKRATVSSREAVPSVEPGTRSLDSIINPRQKVESRITQADMKRLLSRTLENALGNISSSSWHLHAPIPVHVWQPPRPSTSYASNPTSIASASNISCNTPPKKISEGPSTSSPMRESSLRREASTRYATGKSLRLDASTSEIWLHPQGDQP